MQIQSHLIRFIIRTNWILLLLAGVASFIWASPAFARGVVLGGLIVTINFYLLARTLKRAFNPPHLASPKVILCKYYLRFIASGIIIFFLMARKVVNPLGLIAGLSVVVVSMMLLALLEAKKIRIKEAV